MNIVKNIVVEKPLINSQKEFFNANNLTESTDINQLRGSIYRNRIIPSITLEQFYGKRKSFSKTNLIHYNII